MMSACDGKFKSSNNSTKFLSKLSLARTPSLSLCVIYFDFLGPIEQNMWHRQNTFSTLFLPKSSYFSCAPHHGYDIVSIPHVFFSIILFYLFVILFNLSLSIFPTTSHSSIHSIVKCTQTHSPSSIEHLYQRCEGNLESK